MACVQEVEVAQDAGKGDAPKPKHLLILSYVYEGLNFIILCVLGFPWCPIALTLMPPGVGARLVCALGFAINGAAAFGVSTYLAASYEVGGLSMGQEYMEQAANVAPFCFLLGWFLGMSALMFAELHDYKFNKEREDCDAAFSRVILAKYGFKLKFNIGSFPKYNFVYWSTACVIGAVASELAKYIGTPKTELACSNNPMVDCVEMVKKATALLDSRGNCCQILDKRFDIGTFLGNAGGIFAATWGTASLIANWGIKAYGIGSPIEKGE